MHVHKHPHKPNWSPATCTSRHPLPPTATHCQITITVLHLGVFTDGPWRLTLAVAVQAVLLAVRLTYFSRVFRSTTFDFMGALQVTGYSTAGFVMSCV